MKMKVAFSFLLITIVLPEVCFGIKCDACSGPKSHGSHGPAECTNGIDEQGTEETCTDSGQTFVGRLVSVCVADTEVKMNGTVTKYYRGCNTRYEMDIKNALDRCPGSVNASEIYHYYYCFCNEDNCNKPDPKNKGGGPEPEVQPEQSGAKKRRLLSSVSLVAPLILSSIPLLRGIPIPNLT